MLVGDFSGSKKSDQGHVTQGVAHDLHFGAGATKVRAAAPGTANVYRAGNAFLHRRRRTSARSCSADGLRLKHLLWAQFFAYFGANAR